MTSLELIVNCNEESSISRNSFTITGDGSSQFKNKEVRGMKLLCETIGHRKINKEKPWLDFTVDVFDSNASPTAD